MTSLDEAIAAYKRATDELTGRRNDITRIDQQIAHLQGEREAAVAAWRIAGETAGEAQTGIFAAALGIDRNEAIRVRCDIARVIGGIMP